MYLIHAATQTFWQVIMKGSNTEVSWGKIGSKGCVLAKQHATSEDANAYAIKRVIDKTKIGYIEATPIRKSRRIRAKLKKVKHQANKRKAQKRTTISNKKRKKKSSRTKKIHTKKKSSKRMILQSLAKKRGRVASNIKSRVNKRKKSTSKSSNKPDPKKSQRKRRKKISNTKDTKKKIALKKAKSVPPKISATGKKTRVKKKPPRTKKGLNRKSTSIQNLVSTGKLLVDDPILLGKSYKLHAEKSNVYDAMLNLRNAKENIDKFYILQLLKSNKGFLFYTRWGRTGTRGQTKSVGPFKDKKSAVEQFEKKFKEKTGVAWGAKNSLLGKSNPNSKKYSILRITYSPPSKNVTWQYLMDDGVDGKSDGWYDYSKSGSAEVEKVWQQHQANASANLGIRHVQSGYFVYEVDFRKMQQTNVSLHTRKRRRIRRFIK